MGGCVKNAVGGLDYASGREASGVVGSWREEDTAGAVGLAELAVGRVRRHLVVEV